MRAKSIKDGKPLASEHDIQKAFVQWCRLNETKYPALRLAFAVPNAAKRSMALAQIMRDEGLRAGVPDWWLPVHGLYSGLVIEFKSENGRLTDAQKNYRFELEVIGWRYAVCRTPEEAIAIVEDYLK